MLIVKILNYTEGGYELKNRTYAQFQSPAAEITLARNLLCIFLDVF